MRRLLFQQLAKATLVVLVSLVLFGVYSGTALAGILILFVALRFACLLAEATRKPFSAEHWQALTEKLIHIHEQSTPEERAAKATALALGPPTSARELAQAQVSQARQQNPPPRQKRELIAEALGVLAFVILLPATVALFSRDFFSLRTPQGWTGTAVIALCLVLYAWPHRWMKSARLAVFRIWWWALPFGPFLFLMIEALQSRHPYLNPFHPNHAALAATRVLKLKNNVVAGHHADWVLRYARQLDEGGQSKEALHFYRAGVRLDANDRRAYERLAILEARYPGDAIQQQTFTPDATPSSKRFFGVEKKLPRCQIDSRLENVEESTVVLVPVGNVPDEILEAIGTRVRAELNLPVLISSNSVPLPSHTRVQGLLTGRQWDADALIKAMLTNFHPFPKAPIKYVLITPVDIYGEDVNYVFSTSFEWGALVSLARFGEPKGDGTLMRQRAAKQTLCALIKSFNVPMSPDRQCVTSYARSLEEFDAKGDRPNAATMALFQRAVVNMNDGWKQYQARRR